MKETIFYLEGRGGQWPYHFLIYNLGALYYIHNKIYNFKCPDSVLLNDKSKIVDSPTTDISFPIKIYMENVLPFQRQAFDIIKDKYELIEDLSKIENYEVVSIYGASADIIYNNNEKHVFQFLRNLFLEKMDYKIIPGKRIFITRKGSEIQHFNVLKRCILNEEQLIPMLNKYNFEYVKLEDYNTYEKIKLFMESETILSSHSGSLSFLLFANENAKIIEILNKGVGGVPDCHYINMCGSLNINHNRYTNICEDSNGNFKLNVEDFEKYLNSVL